MGMCVCAQFLMPFFWYSTALSRKSAVCVTIDRARLPSFHYDIRILLFSFAFCFLFFSFCCSLPVGRVVSAFAVTLRGFCDVHVLEQRVA